MTIKTDRASSTYCKERSLTIETESLRTMGQEWAGPRIGTLHTGLRTGERLRRWRFPSTWSGKSRIRRDAGQANDGLEVTCRQRGSTNAFGGASCHTQWIS